MFDEIGSADISLDDFFNHIESRSEEPVPLSLLWHITRRCNFSCPFCYIRDNSFVSDIRYEDAEPVLLDLIRAGLLRATISGGECLLAPAFSRVYTLLKREGVFVTLYTNASLIDDALMALFVELPPLSVEVTFYNDEFESRPYRNVLMLRDAGIHVVGKFTVSADNVELFAPVRNWCDENVIEFRFDTDLFNGANGVDAVSQSISGRQRDLFDVERYRLELAKDWTKDGPICGFECKASSRSVFISPEFELSLCCDLEEKWSLEALGFEGAYEELRRYVTSYMDVCIDGCSGCNARLMCKMCIAHAEKTGVVDAPSFRVPVGYCASVQARYEKLAATVAGEQQCIFAYGKSSLMTETSDE